MRYVFTTSVGRVEVVVHEEERIASVYRLDAEQRPVAAAMESWDETDLADLLAHRLGVGPAEAHDVASFVQGKHPALQMPRRPVEDLVGEDPRTADGSPRSSENASAEFPDRWLWGSPEATCDPAEAARTSRRVQLRGLIQKHLVFGTWWLACTLGAVLGIHRSFFWAEGHYLSAPWSRGFVLLLVAAVLIGWVLSHLLFWAAETGWPEDDAKP